MMTGQMAEHTFASLSSISRDQLSSKFFWHKSDRKVLWLLLSVWKSIIAVICYLLLSIGKVFVVSLLIWHRQGWQKSMIGATKSCYLVTKVFQDNGK